MWILNVVSVTVIACIIECYALNVSRSDGSKKTLATPGYDSVSKTIRLQKCFATTEFNAGKIPILLYDLESHPKQTQIHRYYNESKFLYINPMSVTSHGETFTCPHGTEYRGFNLTKHLKPPQYFLPNGYLRLYNHAEKVTSYLPPPLYCINSVSDELVNGKACIPKENSTLPRIRRCRKSFPSFIFNLVYPINDTEAPIEMDQLPKENMDAWDIYRDSRFPTIEGSTQLPYYFHKELTCETKKLFYMVSDPAVTRTPVFPELSYLDIRVTKEGKLKGRNSGSESWRPIQSVLRDNEFCMEKGYVASISGSVTESDTNGHKILKPEYQRLILNCHPESKPGLVKIYHYFILAGMVFLLAILITYALVWNQQSLRGKIAAGFVSSMFIVFMSQYLNNLQAFQIRSKECVANGIIQHFFILTMYSWMAVMNYDVWQALTTVRHASQDKSTRKCIFYCLITYGSAGIIVSTSAILHFSYEIDTEKIIHPQYGFWVCYMNFSVSNYYMLPGTLLAFTISICFSLMTCRTLFKWSKATKKLNKSKNSNAIDNWLLALKVFVLTGISWGLDIAYKATHGLEDEITVGWWLADVYNFLQAALMFWIFVVKREIRDQLCHKYKIAAHIFHFWDRQVAKVTMAPASHSQDTVCTSEHVNSNEPSGSGGA